MLQRNPWLLPDGFEEVLPGDAHDLELLRQRLLGVFDNWGYELVIPPLIDYLESLLTGSGRDLDLQTFKLTDQLSGEMLGIRADMTPLVARIDAHHLRHDWPTRLCYAGTVLHTCGDPLEKTRSPLQIGAELYGHAGIESDIEIIQLMLEMLAMAGTQEVHLDLGHVGIYRSIARCAHLTEHQESELFGALQRKAGGELADLLTGYSLPEPLKLMLLQLPELNGDRGVIDKARKVLTDAGSEVQQALTDLARIADKLRATFPSLPISFDLAELRGYRYHTGVVFAAFVPSMGREIARGGRYDNVGAIFGRARPATGFSADLKVLSVLGKSHRELRTAEIIFAPAVEDIELTRCVRDLRAAGKTVIRQLPEQTGSARDMGCTAVLEKRGEDWIISSLL
ncbi:MAG: ATP phosphoribosyltransferase regulatory subunit [Gammaproteobacteria bacterium]